MRCRYGIRRSWRGKLENTVKRRGRDSNPRYGFPHTRSPGVPVQPLLHLSKSSDNSMIAKKCPKINALILTPFFRFLIIVQWRRSQTMNNIILTAEDQQHIRKLIEYKLTNCGYVVVAVEDGVQALEKARELLPALIMLDVMMPQMTGFEVLAALKADERTRSIPVLLVTAQSKEEEVLKGLEMGAEDYITKPFSPNELAARVRKVLLRKGGT